MRFDSAALSDMLAGADPQRTILLANIEFPSGWIFAHTGVGEVFHNGQRYTGLGQMAEVSEFSEDSTTSAKQLTLTLYIDDSDIFASVMNQDPMNRAAEVYLASLDEHRRISAVELLYAGDIVNFSLAKNKPYAASIVISDWLEIWANPVNNSKYSDSSQQALHAGDTIFDQVEALAKGIDDTIAGKQIGTGSSGGSSGSRRRNQL
ncbi:hypothetical protein JYB87_11810 [Shewanella avicenniae]|uniref:Uncharacterized protein n=1 Tax=Shewanella avicenniae TaxID=2814294 RepID=A0ABX7QN54_9GAMM|nr:hypothetical protein [Shewanella avicenniae]QSX32452.1 hypothetical protein JYB87_11810 [Shewanella avicenniae]